MRFCCCLFFSRCGVPYLLRFYRFFAASIPSESVEQPAIAAFSFIHTNISLVVSKLYCLLYARNHAVSLDSLHTFFYVSILKGYSGRILNKEPIKSVKQFGQNVIQNDKTLDRNLLFHQNAVSSSHNCGLSDNREISFF